MEQIKKERKGFYMLRSFVEMIKGMDPQDAKEYILALADYSMDGIEKELKGEAKYAFKSSKIFLDRSLQTV